MKRLLLLCLLIGIGIYLYLMLYKNDYYDSNEMSSPRIRRANVHKQNEINQLKSILKQHSNDFINDDFIEQPITVPNAVPNAVPNTVPNAVPNTVPDTVPDRVIHHEPLSNKHVHFSEQNEEFIFSGESSVDPNQLNSDIFMESSFNTDKNINLTLSENEYFSKNL
jgi:hypothetical protein